MHAKIYIFKPVYSIHMIFFSILEAPSSSTVTHADQHNLCFRNQAFMLKELIITYTETYWAQMSCHCCTCQTCTQCCSQSAHSTMTMV